jgi:hypothetical protein
MSRRSIALCVSLFAALLMTLPGCASRVNFEKSLALEPMEIKTYTIDAPRGAQKIRIEVDSKEPIDVDVAFESDAERFQTYLERGRTSHANKDGPPPVLASKQNVTQHSLEATVPAGKAFSVLISGAKKKTDVKLKVNSF